jgi:hypothetical protein
LKSHRLEGERTSTAAVESRVDRVNWPVPGQETADALRTGAAPTCLLQVRLAVLEGDLQDVF